MGFSDKIKVTRNGSFIALSMIGSMLIASCERSQPPPPPPIPEVSVMVVGAGTVELTTELPGRTSAPLIAEIRPQVSGIIQKRLFTEGSDVKEGQILYHIDPAPFKAALDQSEANLSSAKKGAERARAALEASIANVARQKATLELAMKNLSRLEELFKERAVSAVQLDQAKTDVQVAEASLRAVEAQVESDKQALAAAEAAIKQAEALLNSARINFGYTNITAPISGRIGKSNVTVGALVTAHQPLPLATIQQIDPIYVDLPQSTAELLRLQQRLEAGKISREGGKENRVRIILEDGRPYEHEGILQFQDITVDPSTGSVILRVLVPNPRGILLPGMFVKALVKEGILRKAILVPQEAVSRDPKGNPIAMIVDSEGRVAQRTLTLDRAIGDKWLVSSGLSTGERIIVEGIQKVRPGMSVKIAPMEVGKKVPEGPSQNAPPAKRTD